MATVNLGSIKFKWQGAYNGATAYTVDDVVSYNGSSYICIANSTGNLPTNTSYFEQMSSAGTDGTDLTSTLTTQGDILYRDGSGLQRLGAGVAGQALITGGAGANPSWSSITFNDDNIVNDISTLALRQASDADRVAYNTNSSFVDVFQDANSITNLTNCSRSASEYISSLSFGSESYDSGDRTSIYTVTDNGIWETGSPARTDLIDGSTSPNLLVLKNGVSQTGVFIRFDLGAGNSKIYTGAKFTLQSTAAQAGSAWAWEGSNDNITYTTLLGGQVWGDGANNPQEFSWSNITAYRYLQFIDRTGSAITTNYNNYNYEWNFKSIATTFNATGSFEGVAITAPSSVSSMGAVITYQDNAGTNALNTDIVLELSADNGSNWSTATLSALPNFSTGIKMAKVNDLAVTAGTQLKYRLNFANQASGSKEARIRGVALQY